MGGKFSYISIFSTIFMELDHIISIDWGIFSDLAKLSRFVDATSPRTLSGFTGPLKINAWLLALALFMVLSARAKLINRRESIVSRIAEIKSKTATG